VSFYLTHAAVADLVGIGEYTEEHFGLEQRNQYLDRLDRSFHDLDEMPGLGHCCDHYRRGYHQYLVGRHWVFYRRVNESDIEIVRILHQQMDPFRHIT